MMFKTASWGIFLFKIALVLTKKEELPLCPTNVLYFPQNLPMHCRMPTNADFPGMAGAFPTVPQIHQNPPSDKHPPLPMSMPLPPGISGPMQFPGPMPIPGPIAMPGPMGPPGPMPFPGAIPLPPGPSQKLPVIVMPYYSPDPNFKKAGRPNYPKHPVGSTGFKRRHKRRKPVIYSPDTSSSTDTDTSLESSSSSSSEYQGWWKGKRNHRRFNRPNKMKKRKRYQKRQLLTPVLQYVTKDGYVIFEKKISKTEAKDWLNVKNDERAEIRTQVTPEARDMESNEPSAVHVAEKETITEDNVEVITRRNAHRLNGIKEHREKSQRRRHMERPR